jgi:hypothetical protein
MFTNVSLLQTEINTHLNILHIVLNANYAASTSTSAALTQMRTIYSRTATQGWHYTSPNGIKPDLHHAVLGKNLGGGIAYVGVICRQDYGFGLSASLSGGYASMSNAVVWDMMVVSIVVQNEMMSDTEKACILSASLNISRDFSLSILYSSCTSLVTTLTQATPTNQGLIPP